MNRKQAREFVMQTMFQIEVHKDFDKSDFDSYLAECNGGNQKEYIKNLLTSICGNIEKIDGMIDAASEGWPSSRMAKPDLAIIRVAVGEILFADEYEKPGIAIAIVNITASLSARSAVHV